MQVIIVIQYGQDIRANPLLLSSRNSIQFLHSTMYLNPISGPLFKKASWGPKNVTAYCSFPNFFLFWGGGVSTIAVVLDELCKPCSCMAKLEVLKTEKRCQFLWLGSKGEIKKVKSFCSYSQDGQQLLTRSDYEFLWQTVFSHNVQNKTECKIEILS